VIDWIDGGRQQLGLTARLRRWNREGEGEASPFGLAGITANLMGIAELATRVSSDASGSTVRIAQHEDLHLIARAPPETPSASADTSKISITRISRDRDTSVPRIAPPTTRRRIHSRMSCVFPMIKTAAC
jgi:hypothetical protein